MNSSNPLLSGIAFVRSPTDNLLTFDTKMTRKKKSKTFSERSWRTLVGGKRRRPKSPVAWRRTFLGFGKVLLLLILVGGIGFGFWWGREFLARQSGPLDLAGPSVPIASVSFKSDGVLDLGWINDRLDLPVKKALMELDLHEIQVKLESEPQIASARVSRLFPDILGVELIERKPVLRLGVLLRRNGFLSGSTLSNPPFFPESPVQVSSARKPPQEIHRQNRSVLFPGKFYNQLTDSAGCSGIHRPPHAQVSADAPGMIR